MVRASPIIRSLSRIIIGLLVVLAATASVIFWLGWRWTETAGLRATSFDMQAANSFVATVQTQNGLPNQETKIQLPQSFAGHVRDMHCYVTDLGQQSTALLFITLRLKGTNIQGYIYVKGPLTLQSSATVKLWYPEFSEGGSDDNAEVRVDQNLGQGWYEVSRSED
jgi:hypothetical protein